MTCGKPSKFILCLHFPPSLALCWDCLLRETSWPRRAPEPIAGSLEVRIMGQKAGWRGGCGNYATQAFLVALNPGFWGSRIPAPLQAWEFSDLVFVLLHDVIWSFFPRILYFQNDSRGLRICACRHRTRPTPALSISRLVCSAVHIGRPPEVSDSFVLLHDSF